MSTISRRHFLGTAAVSATTLALTGPSTVQAATDLRQYEPNLRDRLWMWGHGPDTLWGYPENYKIPEGNKIDMADAIESMGIPNVCVIRWLGKPEPPFDEYVKQFRKTKRVAWSIIDSAKQSYEQKKRWAFELCGKMPNLVNLFLDDFFIGRAGAQAGETLYPAHLSLKQLEELRKEMEGLKKKTDLSVVLYSRQLHPEIKHHIDYCNVVSYWTWDATDLTALENNFNKYREIVPDKPTLLGIYMWDFGGKKPVTMDLMKHQLDFALKKFQQKQIEGMIFHCTPLVDLGLEAVDYSRKWIAEHGDLVR